MIRTRMKNLSLVKILSVLGVIVLPLLMIPSQSHLAAYANAPSSKGPAFSSEQNRSATVEAIVLNVREEPDLSGRVIGKLNLGTRITIYEEQSGWAKVAAPSGVKGWVYEYYIAKAATGSRQETHAEVNSAPAVHMLNNLGPLTGRTVVLDPGHGGVDNGTTSIAGTPEKKLTLETAQAVEQKLKSAGATVIMTRTSDTYNTLQQCVDPSNQNQADAFISFHYNWSNDPSVNGLTDFYYHQSKDDPLAADILNEVAKSTGMPNDGTRFDDLYVLRNNSQPSTLIELGFLSNNHDDSVVESDTYRNNVAEGVYLGLLDYFKK